MRGVQADNPENLGEAGARQAGAGTRFLAIGIAMLAIGAVLLLLDITFGGWVFLGLGVVPTAVGVALWATAAVARRSAAGKPFV